MTGQRAPAVPDPAGGAAAAPGDAASYLEDLLTGAVPVAAQEPSLGPNVRVEILGAHLRVAGRVVIGRFGRLSDVLNMHTGLIEVRDAAVLYRDGSPTRVVAQSLWVSLGEVTLVGQLEEDVRDRAPEFRIVKEPYPLLVVSSGHTIAGDVYIPRGGDVASFIAASDPMFLPMTNVRARSLADRRVSTHYAFALLNRRQIVAATQALPGAVE